MLSQLVRQAYKRGEIQLFRAQAAIHPGGLDSLCGQQGLEGVAQRLAALVERFAHHALKQAVILGGMWQHLVWHQADDETCP